MSDVSLNQFEREVTEEELTRLATRLGNDWRAFMRSELEIKQIQIENIEADGTLPHKERVFRLLLLWKRGPSKSTTINLIERLQHFEYEVDVWSFLTNEETKGNDYRNRSSARSFTSDFDNRSSVGSSKSGAGGQSLSFSEDPFDSVTLSGQENVPKENTCLSEPPYDTAINHQLNTSRKQFRFVVEITEAVYSHFTGKDVVYQKGDELDVVDKTTRSDLYNVRDVDGRFGWVSIDKCRRLTLRQPIMWQNEWYHEKATRSQAEASLIDCAVGTFLIRESSQNPNLALSIIGFASKIFHFRIDCSHVYTVSSSQFDSLTEMISFYRGNCIFTTHGGRLFVGTYLPKSTELLQPLRSDL